ncbi:MAG: MBL fold metallo-hydrolase [Chloroflexi bacterium]|nr:MBL fold metallo-hydrolase [Chloroflexota bacterium]
MEAHAKGAVHVYRVICSPERTNNNAYIVVCPKTSEAVIIDTPLEPEKVVAAARPFKVKAILITHQHWDHLEGFKVVKEAIGAPAWIHPLDAEAMPQPPDLDLKPEGVLKVGTFQVKAIHAPGHTPGATCYLIDRFLFTGDTLFPGGPGATRTPANLKTIIQSITQRLHGLADNTVVYPGHGAETTIGTSKKEYAVFASKTHPPDLCGDVLWLKS